MTASATGFSSACSLPSRTISACTRLSVSGATRSGWRSTLVTVCRDTRAASATVFTVAAGFALAAAFLNAAFAFCLGCEVYLLVRRITA